MTQAPNPRVRATPPAPGRPTAVARAGTQAPAPRNPSGGTGTGGRAAPGQRSGAPSGARAAFSRLRTPTRLRLAMVAAVLCSLLVAGGGLALGLAQSALLGGAAAHSHETAGLLRAGTYLTLSNATTTNAFLIGGLEPADSRALADSYLEQGAVGLAELAGTSGATADASLAQAAAALPRYAGLAEQARANNRQGFPVGVAYLDEATAVLDDTVLPGVAEAVRQTAQNAAGSYNGVGAMVGYCLILVLPLLGLIWLQVWLARRTRRTFNVPFAIGTALALGAAIAGFAVFNSTAEQSAQVRQTRYVPTLAVGQALSQAAQARSEEAFALIRRGGGAAHEEGYQAALGEAQIQLDRARNIRTGPTAIAPLITAIEEWDQAHQEIRQLDDAGDWEGAVALAISPEPQSATARYGAFATQAEGAMTELAAATQTGLASLTTPPRVMAWVLAGAGAACAILAFLGLSHRLEEYR